MAGIRIHPSISESSILSENRHSQLSRRSTEDSVQTISTNPTSLGDGSSTPALDSPESSKLPDLNPISVGEGPTPNLHKALEDCKTAEARGSKVDPTLRSGSEEQGLVQEYIRPTAASALPEIIATSSASDSIVPPRPQRRADAKIPEVPPTKAPGVLKRAANYLFKVQRCGQVAPPANEYYFPSTSDGGLSVPRKVPTSNIPNLMVEVGKTISYQYLHSLDGSGSQIYHSYAAVRVGAQPDCVSAFAAVRAYKKHSSEGLELKHITPMSAIRQEIRVLRLREKAETNARDHILGAYMVMQDSDCIYFVSPLMRCSLLDILVNPSTKALGFDVAIKKCKLPWIVQMVEGLRCLHELGVMHRNIKPSSFLVNLDGRLMLSDFTHSYIRSDAGEPLEEGLRYAYRVRGRLEYMAPEMRAMARQKKAHDQAGTMDLDEAIPGLAGYGREADVWSLGCVIAELLRVCEGKKFRPLFQCLANPHTIFFPWMHDLRQNLEVDPHEVYVRKHTIQQFVYLENFTNSDGFIRIVFLNQFLQAAPGRRIHLDRVRKHPFLTALKHNYDKLLWCSFRSKNSDSMVVKCDPSQESDYVAESLRIDGRVVSSDPGVTPVLDKMDTFCYLNPALKLA